MKTDRFGTNMILSVFTKFVFEQSIFSSSNSNFELADRKCVRIEEISNLKGSNYLVFLGLLFPMARYLFELIKVRITRVRISIQPNNLLIII